MVQALDEYDIQQDLPYALRLMDEMVNNVKQVSDVVGNMLQRVKTGELTTEYGLSFLEVKYHMLLDYLINLTYIVLRKSSGQTIQNDPAIDRLIEIRTVLEKIRPIDHKLRYQIDKLVKTAASGDSSDPTSFKANPDNLISQLPGDSDEDESEDEDSSDQSTEEPKKPKKAKNAKQALYVPPKLTAMHYEDEEGNEKSRKQLERARKRALNTSIIQDLKEEYLDTPLEITGSSKAQQMLTNAQREKEEYEETYLTRLPISKAEMHRQKRLTTLGSLGDELTKFGDISALNGTKPSSSASGGSSGRKRKRGGNTKRGGGGGKKKKFR